MTYPTTPTRKKKESIDRIGVFRVDNVSAKIRTLRYKNNAKKANPIKKRKSKTLNEFAKTPSIVTFEGSNAIRKL